VDPWVAVLVVEAVAVVALLSLTRRVGRDAADATAAWRGATERLTPALVALRDDAHRTRLAIEHTAPHGDDAPRR
jgi:hypothetical protein